MLTVASVSMPVLPSRPRRRVNVLRDFPPIVSEAGMRTPHLYVRAEREAAPVGDVALLKAFGGVDVSTHQAFHTRVDAELARRAWSVVVNLADVPFLDAEGVGELLCAQRLVRGTTGGTLLLSAIREQGRKTLEVKGLSSLLTCFSTTPKP